VFHDYVYIDIHTLQLCITETGCSVVISADNWQYLWGDKKLCMSISARLYS